MFSCVIFFYLIENEVGQRLHVAINVDKNYAFKN